MKVLIHTCCAPCLTFPLSKLEVASTTVFFHNPNIQPYSEYKLRRDCLRQYCESQQVSFIEGTYDLEKFFREVVFREEVRCSICYQLRLAEAAKYARQGKFDFFTTTLLVSPYQKHETIRDLGRTVGKRYGVPFLYCDFRKGWNETISISRQLGLYRQKYCGCVYSERERFDKDYSRKSKNKVNQTYS